MKPQTILRLKDPITRTNLDYDSIGYKVYLSFSASGIKQVEDRPALHAMSVQEAEKLAHDLIQTIAEAKVHNQRLGRK